jgi:inactive STAND
MTRRRQATQEELQHIKHAARQRGWTTKEDSLGLIAASRILIEQKLEKCPKRKNYLLPLSELERWRDDEEINLPDSGGFTKFINEIRKQGKETVDTSEISALVGDEEDGKKHRIIRAKGISERSIRDFLNGKSLNQEVFMAYWDALKLDREYLSGLHHSGSSSYKSHQLYKALLSFDYRESCDRIQYIAQNSCRSAAFLIPPTQQSGYPYSQVWLMRRIEQELLKFSDLETRPPILFSLDSNFETYTIEQLYLKLGSELRNSKIEQVLKKENLILVMNGIDTYDRDRLDALLDRFWQNLVKQVSKSPGFLILFLVDGGKPNNWRDVPGICDRIVRVSAIPSFSVEHLRDDLGEIAGKLQQTLPEPDINGLVKALIEHQQKGEVNLILKTIYQQFNCRFSAETRWQQYPEL